MNVLVVSHLLGRAAGGGIAARSAAVARALSAQGAQVHVLGTDAGLAGEHDRIHEGPATVLRTTGGRFAVPVGAASRVTQLVRDADVVLLFNHWSMLNALVARHARREGVPWVVCPSGALVATGRSLVIKRVYNAMAGGRLVRDAAARVATTERERADFAAYGIDPTSVAVIPNAIDPVAPSDETALDARAIALRARFGIGERPIVLFVGRLNEIKGPDLLVEAFASLAGAFESYCLVLAGPDEGLGPSLAATATARGANVILTGVLDAIDLAALYETASLLAVPSRREAMSLVAIEAAVHGTPVLMTDVCGMDDFAESGGGAIVESSSEGLARGLRRLLAKPADLAPMGACLRAHVLARYGWTVVGPLWYRLLASAARRRRPRSLSSRRRTPS